MKILTDGKTDMANCIMSVEVFYKALIIVIIS